MNASTDDATQLRWRVYALLIALATGAMVGRILAVDSVDEGKRTPQNHRPFLSANDRSRWVTVRSLVEHGTYEIDQVVAERGWDTIDMVKHRGRDGEEHLYSSKPPLLATLMAGEYWLINRLTGATLGDFPYEVGRFMILSINVPAMLIYFFCLARLAERIGTTDWGRIFMLAAAAFGTFLTTFVVSINNHTLAAVCAAIVLLAVVRIVYDGARDIRTFALAGLFSALAVTNELPALSLCVLVGAALLWKAPRKALLGFLPPALLVAAAATGTNYLAHESLRPPYMHRSLTDPADNWYDYSFVRDGRVRDSYWRHPVGIDQGEPDVATYVWHCTLGHHGIFSLTPIWLLSVWGLALLWRADKRELAAFITVLSLVCLAFYFSRTQGDRNYGGMTSGLRWMFWFAPLWLVALLPAADRLATSRAGRGLGLILLALSVTSASYPTWNPWTQPWLWNFMTYLGWNG